MMHLRDYKTHCRLTQCRPYSLSRWERAGVRASGARTQITPVLIAANALLASAGGQYSLASKHRLYGPHNSAATRLRLTSAAAHFRYSWDAEKVQRCLLPGVERALALRDGKQTEALVRVEDLPRVQGWAFLNSLRGWIGAQMV